ncbi:MAG: hypothetical protein BGP06_13375 [Rhizobiales bacterium 65-9]|nr:MAG: hypothetical protein BGP06_13375 [Rhizobiales bacterium 65-9]
MEEILASIRRIIADDQPAKPESKAAPAPDEPPPAAPTPIEDDILDLEDEPPAPEPDEVMFEEDVAPEPPAPPPVPPAPQPAPQARLAAESPRAPVYEPETLLSQKTNQAVGQAFQNLAGTIFSGSQRTLDDVVRELLRPMLKEWLDDNLPGIVERLVRAEIERVARGGR